MGALCSTGADQHPGDEALSPDSENSASRHIFSMAPSFISEKITRQKSKAMLKDFTFASEADYANYRLKLLADESGEGFDGQAQKNATALERRASKIVFKIKEKDALIHFGGVREEFNGRVHFPESHFLTTVDIINKTDLIQCAQRLPKGAHLHCHFNSCLPPIFLLREAKRNPHMFIKSDICLHPEIRENFPLSEIQFQMHLIEDQKDLKESLSPQNKAYRTSYTPADKMTGWYSYDRFLEEFEILNEDGEREYGEEAAERWLASKLVFTESQTYDAETTGKGIWYRFGTHTRMLKGLFGHESAFRAYTFACIDDFIKDNIQYAEIRPNFPSNQLVRSDATGYIDNKGLLEIIKEEVGKQHRLHPESTFTGLKVIYCCPRSFPNDRVKASLDECIELKEAYPDLICGYDLVGGEEAGFPIRKFVPELLAFRAECKERGLDIPFLFHAGETLDTGSSTDENLLDAILLNSKRIGHGFALPKHPRAMELVKQKNIALEICPISNEVLHLCPTIRGHTLPVLLANNVHCTVNSDNGTFYNSTLSHDFYQVMIGSESMSLLGWKVLAEWSIDHSCLDDEHKKDVRKEWRHRWKNYCKWIVDTYGSQFPTENSS